MEKCEFRLLLVYLRQYFELFVMFNRIDTSDPVYNDQRIDLNEFKAAVPLFKVWGYEVPYWLCCLCACADCLIYCRRYKTLKQSSASLTRMEAVRFCLTSLLSGPSRSSWTWRMTTTSNGMMVSQDQLKQSTYAGSYQRLQLHPLSLFS